MQVTIIRIVIGAFGTVTKGLLKGLEDFIVKEAKILWIYTLRRGKTSPPKGGVLGMVLNFIGWWGFPYGALGKFGTSSFVILSSTAS